MHADAVLTAAGYLADAFETGNPLAPLPEGLAPAGRGEGEAVAEALVERLGLAVAGLRLAPGPGGAMLAGPMLDTRLLRDGAALPIGTLRHGRVSAAAIGVLAAALDPEAQDAPRLAAVQTRRGWRPCTPRSTSPPAASATARRTMPAASPTSRGWAS